MALPFRQPPVQQGGGYGPKPQGWQGNIRGPQAPQQGWGGNIAGPGLPQHNPLLVSPRTLPGATYQDFPRAVAPMQNTMGAMQSALASMMPGMFGGKDPFAGGGPKAKGAGAFQNILRDMIMKMFGGGQ